MKTLIIDRETWSRGTSSSLLNSMGMRCCLGFECNRVGLSDMDILDIPTPEDLDILDKVKHLVDEGMNNEIVDILISINDAAIGDNLYFCGSGFTVLESEEHREELIKLYFSKLDINVEFIN